MSATQPVLNKAYVTQKKSHITSKVLCSSFLFLAIFLFFVANWYVQVFGNTGFDSILFTLFSDTAGVKADNLSLGFFLRAILPTFLAFGFSLFLLFILPQKTKIKFLQIKHWCSVVISLVLSILLLFSAAQTSGLIKYIQGMATITTIFEDEYVDPMSIDIEFPEKKRNLIYIFLESMEVTYASKEQGGGLDNSIITELYDLAKKNINFSHNDGVGGFLTPNGTTWTVAAMTAHTSGVPLKSPPSFERNTYGKDAFLPGLNTLTDILNKNGYYQALMVGSDAKFANRDVYYNNHGVDKIYDLYTAQKDGIVPEGYHVWWGMEDENLFDYAKQELPKIAKQDKPFSFTLLTVDTHFTDGYICRLCKKEHEEQYENVIQCSSKQVKNFINWLKTQKFYKDTTIIIAGDHLTMDSQYISRNVEDGYSQRVYNCIINSAVTSNTYKNREFTSFDMFPTTLASLGCNIPGERLGLGTNLFSGKKTLVEELGYSEFNHQIGLNSKYYNENFMN